MAPAMGTPKARPCRRGAAAGLPPRACTADTAATAIVDASEIVVTRAQFLEHHPTLAATCERPLPEALASPLTAVTFAPPPGLAPPPPALALPPPAEDEKPASGGDGSKPESDVFKVLLRGFPEAMAREPMLSAILMHAELHHAVLGKSVRPGGKVLVTLSSMASALQCIRHFHGRQWNDSEPITALLVRTVKSGEVAAQQRRCSDKALSAEAAVFVPGLDISAATNVLEPTTTMTSTTLDMEVTAPMTAWATTTTSTVGAVPTAPEPASKDLSAEAPVFVPWSWQEAFVPWSAKCGECDRFDSDASTEAHHEGDYEEEDGSEPELYHQLASWR